jgi:hypothetical protein
LIVQWLAGLGRRMRWLAAVSVALMVGWGGWYSALQLGTKVEDPDKMHLDRVPRAVPPDAILFVQIEEPVATSVNTALGFYHGLNVVNVDDLWTAETKLRRLVDGSEARVAYMLSDEPRGSHQLEEVEAFDFAVEAFVGNVMPTTRGSWMQRRIASPPMVRALGWTDGDTTISGLSYEVPSQDRYLIVTSMGSHPASADLEKLKLRVEVNDGITLSFERHAGNSYLFRLPEHVGKIGKVRIRSATFVPKEIGRGMDTRRLGVDVAQIATDSGW